MKIDERLNTLCREFIDLEEVEKDYILGISQVLTESIYKKGSIPLPVTGIINTNINRSIHIQYEECLS